MQLEIEYPFPYQGYTGTNAISRFHRKVGGLSNGGEYLEEGKVLWMKSMVAFNHNAVLLKIIAMSKSANTNPDA